MNERKYYSQLSYFIKAILVIVVVGVFYYIIIELSDQLANALSRKLRANLVFIKYILDIVFGIIGALFIAVILLRGKPQIVITDTMIRTNRFKRKFDELQSYHPGKGGSEPYIISKEGKQHDLELSWFSKKDRQEIEAFLQERIKSV